LVTLIPRIDQLIQEKKQSKKRLIDDKNKYSCNLEFHRDAIDKCKREIQKEISIYSSLKKKYSDPSKIFAFLLKFHIFNTKFSPHLIENRAKRGSEIFSDMTKVVSSVHHLHNQYIITLNEFNEYNDMHTNILLPNLLSSYQKIQESLLEEQ
jgi:hypothetical protein